MPWTAITDHDAVDSGTTIHIDRATATARPRTAT